MQENLQNNHTEKGSEDFLKKQERKLPATLDPDRTREEITFAEFPVTTMARRAGTVFTREIRETVGTDKVGKPIYRSWKMVGTQEYGLPIAGDEDVYVCVTKMLEHYDFKRDVIPCTRYQICKLLGISPNKQKYVRIADAFRRLSTTSFVTDNIFKDPASGAFIVAEKFNIIDSYRFVDRSPAKSHNVGQAELPLSFFRVSPEFLGRLQQANLKSLDMAYWRNLPTHLNRRLYRFLDKNRFRKTTYEIGLVKLGQRLGLSETHPEKELKRLLKPCLETLQERGFLNDWQYRRTADKSAWKLTVHFNPAYHRNTKKRASAGTNPALEEKNAPEAQILANKTASDVKGDLAAELVRLFRRSVGQPTRGVVSDQDRDRALRLLRQLDGDHALARYAITYACNEAHEPVKSFGWVLSNNLPERARQRFEAEERSRVEQEREAGERREREARAQAEEEALEKAWAALSDQERRQRLDQAVEDIRTNYKGTIRNWSEGVLETTARHKARGRLREELRKSGEAAQE